MSPELYAATQAIKRELYAALGRYSADFAKCEDAPNPYYNQTATGLLLVLSRHGVLSRIYTPLGELRLLGSHSIEAAARHASADVLKLFGCARLAAPQNTVPLYTVAQVNGVRLPPYSPREGGATLHGESDYIPYAKAVARWTELRAAYEGTS